MIIVISNSFSMWVLYWSGLESTTLSFKVMKQHLNKIFVMTMHESFFTDLSVFEKVQCNLYILQLVEAHPAFLPRLQETRGRQTSGGENTQGLNDQQTAKPHDWGAGVSVSSNTFSIYKKDLLYLLYSHGLGNFKLKRQQIWNVIQILRGCDQSVWPDLHQIWPYMTLKCIKDPATMFAGESMIMNDKHSQWFSQTSVTTLVSST